MVHSTTTRGKSPLAQWFHETVALDELRVRFQLRGHNLYVYCEAEELPNQLELLGRLLPALRTVDLNTLVPANQPDIEQVFLYGRQSSNRRSQWSSPILLSQLDQHIEQWQQMQTAALESALAEAADEAPSTVESSIAVDAAEAPIQDEAIATPPETQLDQAEWLEAPVVASEPIADVEPESFELPTISEVVNDELLDQGDGAIAEEFAPTAEESTPAEDAIPHEPINLTEAGWHTDFMQPPVEDEDSAASPLADETITKNTNEFSLTDAEAVDDEDTSVEAEVAEAGDLEGAALEAEGIADDNAPAETTWLLPNTVNEDAAEETWLLPNTPPATVPAEANLSERETAAESEALTGNLADDGAIEGEPEANLIEADLSEMETAAESETLTDSLVDDEEIEDGADVDADVEADADAEMTTVEQVDAETEVEPEDAIANATTAEPSEDAHHNLIDEDQNAAQLDELNMVVAPPARPTLILDSEDEPSTETSIEAHSENSGGDELDVTPEPELPAPESPEPTPAPAEKPTKAIARRLTQALSSHGLTVRAKIRDVPSAAMPDRAKRLWIQCEATYSPEPSAVAEAIAQQIRSLNLEGFRDAVAVMQVRGEPTPDWMLKVDLTPPTEMLRDWARWGDVQAIAHLLDREFQSEQITLSSASVQESTLHLTYGWVDSPEVAEEPEDRPQAPAQGTVRAIAEPLLNDLAPQGIHTAIVYGDIPGSETPDWLMCLDLPGKTQPERAASTMERAREGNLKAIAFLLTRLLNPDLDQQLATGGVRVQVVSKPEAKGRNVLHIMTDAPVCPDPEVVSPAIEHFLRDLRMPALAGVRVYGRRAGQKKAIWGKRANFFSRPRLVPEAPPEFAASEAYVSELIAPTDEQAYRPDLTTEDVQSAWQQTRDRFASGIQNLLLRSHLFVPAVPSGVSEPPKLTGTQQRKPGWALAMVWGAAGLLLAVQADLGISRWLRQPDEATQTATVAQMEEVPSPDTEPIDSDPEGATNAPDSFIRFGEEPRAEDAELMTASDLPYTPDTVQEQLITAEILASESPYPTFNAPQLDEKLLLYYERMREQAAASDVLIVGSSRALRGIDPVALQQELTELGYEDVTVFNFSINGATAKVVEFILADLLEAAQLPKVVIWADGARAFNSSTVDVTYNGIAVSPGYRDWQRGELNRPDLSDILTVDAETEAAEEAPTGINASLTASYEAIDRTLSETLGNTSGAFALRDRFKTTLQETVARVVPAESFIPAETVGLGNQGSLPPESLQSLSEQGREMVDFDGFLPIALQFNPATYYQEFARVAGRYDSDYENFRLTGGQTDAMHGLLREMGDRQIPVIFVNLPLTDEYLDGDRQAHEQEFRQFMLQTASDYSNFYFRDLSEVWTTEYDYFSDPSHLNRYGAYEVAHRLAQDPMIPWSDMDKETAGSTTTAQNPTAEP
ncbi:MAG: hypothetical protein AAFX78_03730 [Cyanobacteria bacterium J06638_20]